MAGPLPEKFEEFVEQSSALVSDAMNDYIRRLEAGALTV